MSEVQLIGRRARYCPFLVKNEDGDSLEYDGIEQYKRKFDGAPSHELRILEELYYHSPYKPQFIDNLHKELIEQGWEDDPNLYDEKEIKVKQDVKKTAFWLKEIVIKNKKVKKRYDRYDLWGRLPYGNNGRNLEYKIPSGMILTNVLLDERDIQSYAQIDTRAVDLSLSSLPLTLKLNALLTNEFFDFNNIKAKFPKVKSLRGFIQTYLDQLSIRYFGDVRDLIYVKEYEKSLFASVIGEQNITIAHNVRAQIYQSLLYLCNDIQKHLLRFVTQYQGTEYFKEVENIHTQFKDKTLKIRKGDRRIDDNKRLIQDKDWFIYDAFHGTSEEVAFVKLFNNVIHGYLTDQGYRNIYLVRNEEDYKIFDFHTGEGFCPDFLLFMTDKDNQNKKMQIIIEPKGKHIEVKDDWKNAMLTSLLEKYQGDKPVIFEYGQTRYYIIGMPFYNSAEENKFGEAFKKALEIRRD